MGLKKLIDLDLLDRFLEKVKALIPTKTSDLTNDAGFMVGMTILSYGSSTWSDFITAYDEKKVVYCRASSNSNPASGSQTRLAFMAYVNNAATPTEVEFQYYRSVNAHTDAQQGDQVYVYKLNKTNGWSVTTRNAFTKIVAGTGLGSSYASGTLTLSNSQTALPDVTTTDNDKVLTVVNGVWAPATPTGGGGSAPVIYTSTIPTTGWSDAEEHGVEQNISFSGITFSSSDVIFVDLNITSDETADNLLVQWDFLIRATPITGSSNIRVWMSSEPEVALPVRIIKL